MADTDRPEALGKAIAYRLALRAEATAQVRVVDILAQSNLASEIVLCGSAALQGCYLHGRRVACLDFVARPDTAMRLIPALRHSGVLLSRSPANYEYTVVVKNNIVSNTTVKIRIFPRHTLPQGIETRPFLQGKEHSLAIRTVPFPELVVAKLALPYLRDRPRDYFDLWLSLKQMPGEIPQVKRLLTALREGGSSHVPPNPFHSAFLLKRFLRLEEPWMSLLTGLVDTPPDFYTVRNNLAQWLPVFDTCTDGT